MVMVMVMVMVILVKMGMLKMVMKVMMKMEMVMMRMMKMEMVMMRMVMHKQLIFIANAASDDSVNNSQAGAKSCNKSNFSPNLYRDTFRSFEQNTIPINKYIFQNTNTPLVIW